MPVVGERFLFSVFSAPDAKRMYTVRADKMERDGNFVSFYDVRDDTVATMLLQPGWFVRRDVGTPNTATDPKDTR